MVKRALLAAQKGDGEKLITGFFFKRMTVAGIESKTSRPRERIRCSQMPHTANKRAENGWRKKRGVLEINLCNKSDVRESNSWSSVCGDAKET